MSLPNVKEHATLSAGASVDHGVDVETTVEHVNRAADRGCCVSACSALHFGLKVGLIKSVVAFGWASLGTILDDSINQERTPNKSKWHV